jgi:HlyD family secretion protein
LDIGDRVRKGQFLAELWVPELVEDVHQKEATVIQDEALIVQAQEMLRAAEANYNWAGARLRLAEASKLKAEADVIRWKAQYHRDGKLAKKEYVSREGLEITTDQFQSAEAAKAEAVAAVEAAQAAQAESNAQRAKAVADLRVAEARLRVADADRDHAAAILSYSRIEAPYDGVISRRGTDTGAYVQPPAMLQYKRQLPEPSL